MFCGRNRNEAEQRRSKYSIESHPSDNSNETLNETIIVIENCCKDHCSVTRETSQETAEYIAEKAQERSNHDAGEEFPLDYYFEPHQYSAINENTYTHIKREKRTQRESLSLALKFAVLFENQHNTGKPFPFEISWKSFMISQDGTVKMDESEVRARQGKAVLNRLLIYQPPGLETKMTARTMCNDVYAFGVFMADLVVGSDELLRGELGAMVWELPPSLRNIVMACLEPRGTTNERRIQWVKEELENLQISECE